MVLHVGSVSVTSLDTARDPAQNIKQLESDVVSAASGLVKTAKDSSTVFKRFC